MTEIEPGSYDDFVHRYTKALVRVMREAGYARLAQVLDAELAQARPRARVAWMIGNAPKRKERGPIHDAMRWLPMVWTRQVDLEDLAHETAKLEQTAAQLT